MRLWIAYDDSPERLPKAIADSAIELARQLGVKVQGIKSTAYRVKTGEIHNGKYAYVDMEDNDD